MSCKADTCSECETERQAGDDFCPNCQGQNYTCLTSRSQTALGKNPAFAGTFNDFGMKNTGFCKLQQLHSHNRSTTLGPRLLTDAHIMGGIGLSQAQFGATGQGDAEGSVSCGMCIEVTARMALWNCELTEVLSDRHAPSTWPEQKLVVMVMDQCKDGWQKWSADGTTAQGNCVTGHFDFDVYPQARGASAMSKRAAESVASSQ